MKDPLLFTPGPLTTSATVKAAMQRDIGSRDADFIELVAGIRSELLRIAGVSREQGYEAVLMQGSGTFGLESVIIVSDTAGREIRGAGKRRLWRAHGYDCGAIGNFHQAGTLAGERIAAPRGRATPHRGRTERHSCGDRALRNYHRHFESDRRDCANGKSG